MLRRHARRIWEFVVSNKKRVGAMIVHCEYGSSRSPAVALAIAKVLGLPKPGRRTRTHPSPHVYRLTVAEGRKYLAEQNEEEKGT